jgi:hypothetical protein
MSLSRTLRSTPGIRTCYGSAVSRTSFFDLSSGDADVGLETSDHWRIFEVIQSGKSSSQVGLWRVVDFESIALKVPEEVSRTQSVGMRWIIMASLLQSSWCRRCLLPGVGIDLFGVSRLVAYTWGSSSELLLLSDGSGSIGVLTLLTLFICFIILQWYVRRDDQDLAI